RAHLHVHVPRRRDAAPRRRGRGPQLDLRRRRPAHQHAPDDGGQGRQQPAASAGRAGLPEAEGAGGRAGGGRLTSGAAQRSLRSLSRTRAKASSRLGRCVTLALAPLWSSLLAPRPGWSGLASVGGAPLTRAVTVVRPTTGTTGEAADVAGWARGAAPLPA